LIFFTFLVVAVFFSMIYLRIALDRSAFELDTITDQIAVEESLQLDLRLELAQLQDPQRIASQAEEIGLVYPDERVAIVVDGLNPASEPFDVSVPVRALEGVGP
jgi:cell division protein FtsL